MGRVSAGRAQTSYVGYPRDCIPRLLLKKWQWRPWCVPLETGNSHPLGRNPPTVGGISPRHKTPIISKGEEYSEFEARVEP